MYNTLSTLYNTLSTLYLCQTAQHPPQSVTVSLAVTEAWADIVGSKEKVVLVTIPAPADNIAPCAGVPGGDKRAAGVPHQGRHPAPSLHLLVSTVQYNKAQYTIVQYSTVKYSTL